MITSKCWFVRAVNILMKILDFTAYIIFTVFILYYEVIFNFNF